MARPTQGHTSMSAIGTAAPVVDCDVLVVGLGPVGAALAGLLADAGIETLAVERDVEVYPLPRAAHFDHEIMRLFQQLGIAREILRHARPAPAYEFRSADGQVLLGFPPSDAPGGLGWASGYMFNQPGLETALRAKLAASGAVDVRLSHRLESLEQDAGEVRAVVVAADGPIRVRSRYLVGCDGASSRVREALGIELDDYQFDEPWLVIDVKVRGKGRVPDLNLQICDPKRPTTCVLMGPGRHRWEFMLLPGETAEQVLDDAFIRELLAAWECGDDIEIDRRAVYRFHGLVAKSWRAGRVLLAGDAAHQMPPFAGQGMCSGLRDVANLAWKLVAILRDGADERLLESYQVEREPHVRAYIELAIHMGRVVCTLDPEAAAQRDASMLERRAAGHSPLPPASPPKLQRGVLFASADAGALFPQPWMLVDGAPRGLDDVLGRGAWLIVDGPVPAPASEATFLKALSLADPRVDPFRDKLRKWLAARAVASVLVRPDRYVFGTGDPAQLVAAYAAALHRAL